MRNEGLRMGGPFPLRAEIEVVLLSGEERVFTLIPILDGRGIERGVDRVSAITFLFTLTQPLPSKGRCKIQGLSG
jgi:hypothetical protein